MPKLCPGGSTNLLSKGELHSVHPQGVNAFKWSSPLTALAIAHYISKESLEGLCEQL